MEMAEILEWLAMLSNCNSTRKTIINDLLKHAAGDGMSNEDRATCGKALLMIDAGEVPEAPGPMMLAPDWSLISEVEM